MMSLSLVQLRQMALASVRHPGRAVSLAMMNRATSSLVFRRGFGESAEVEVDETEQCDLNTPEKKEEAQAAKPQQPEEVGHFRVSGEKITIKQDTPNILEPEVLENFSDPKKRNTLDRPRFVHHVVHPQPVWERDDF